MKWILAPLLSAILSFSILGSHIEAQQQTPANPPAGQPSQQSQPASPATSQDKPPEKPKDSSQTGAGLPEQATPKDDRILYTLPNYLTVENADQAPKLTAGEKYKLVAKDTFDWIEYPYVAAIAGLSQLQNSEPGYGQGAAGYGKRYGAAFADTAISSFMTSAVFPSMLKQDPRYYEMGASHAGFWRRAGYSVGRIFVTRTDDGRSQFNSSEIAGNLVAAGISNIYHPAEDRTLANTLSVWGTQTMWDAAANEMKEFWPDMRRWISKKKSKD